MKDYKDNFNILIKHLQKTGNFAESARKAGIPLRTAHHRVNGDISLKTRVNKAKLQYMQKQV